MPKLHPHSKKELVASHYYIHAFYNKAIKGTRIKNWPLSKIIAVHTSYVALFNKYGLKHNSPLGAPKKPIKRPKWWKCINDCSKCEALLKHNICVKQRMEEGR